MVTGAVFGIVQAILWPDAPRYVTIPLYLGLGWAVFPLVPAVRATVGWDGLALLAAYLVRLSARVLLESYTLAPRDAAEPAQSSEPPANAVATPRPT